MLSGFPVRSLTKRFSGDVSTSGEWIRAYRAEQRKHLRAALSSCLQETNEKSTWSADSQVMLRSVQGNPELNMQFLLKHCCITDPRDLCECHINGLGLRACKTDDLAAFDNIVYINASENELSLEAFKAFSMLQELELSLNGIADIHITQKDFTKLQCLNLSYNSVSPVAMLLLGELSALRELHLTGNDIVILPAEFSRPVLTEDRSALKMRYQSLESLWLDDNKLCDQVTFATLAGLRKLKYLNLDNNEIYHIPQLKLLGTSPIKAAVSKGYARNQDEVPDKIQGVGSQNDNGLGGDPGPKQTMDSSQVIQEHATNSNDVINLPSKNDHNLTRQLLATVKSEGTPTSIYFNLTMSTDAGNRNDSIKMAPFPNLETLSIAHNLLFSEESLVACAEWPVLKELIIYGNPITRAGRGIPPALLAKLIRRGVKVVRHKPDPNVRHSIGQYAKHFVTVSSAPPPTIFKHPLAPSDPPLALEQAKTFSPLSSHSSSSTPALSEQDKPVDFASDEGKDLPGVFMTQVHLEDGHHPLPHHKTAQLCLDPGLPSVEDEFETWKREAAARHKDVPPRYKGFEVLLDTSEGTHLPLICDTKSCSQALHYALKHPLMLPSTAMTRPPTSGKYLLRKSSAKPTEPHTDPKVRELRQILSDMRRKGGLVETNLASIFKRKTHKDAVAASELQEANRLLEEMQLRYQQVHTTSLKSLEPITNIHLSPN